MGKREKVNLGGQIKDKNNENGNFGMKCLKCQLFL